MESHPPLSDDPKVLKVYTAACQYHKLGLKLIPLSYQTKVSDGAALRAAGFVNRRNHPSWKRLAEIPQDQALIDLWFGTELRNIGILGMKDLIILDFDRTFNYENWKAKYPEIASSTPTQTSGRGFHVYLRVDKVYRTTWLTNFHSNHTGSWGGNLLGLGSYSVAYPSAHPKGSEYQWLPGQAPWEMEIKHIRDLGEIGYHPRRVPFRVFRFFHLLVSKPGESKNLVRKKIAQLLGERTDENDHIFKKYRL